MYFAILVFVLLISLISPNCNPSIHNTKNRTFNSNHNSPYGCDHSISKKNCSILNTRNRIPSHNHSSSSSNTITPSIYVPLVIILVFASLVIIIILILLVVILIFLLLRTERLLLVVFIYIIYPRFPVDIYYSSCNPSFPKYNCTISNTNDRISSSHQNSPGSDPSIPSYDVYSYNIYNYSIFRHN